MTPYLFLFDAFQFLKHAKTSVAYCSKNRQAEASYVNHIAAARRQAGGSQTTTPPIVEEDGLRRREAALGRMQGSRAAPQQIPGPAGGICRCNWSTTFLTKLLSRVGAPGSQACASYWLSREPLQLCVSCRKQRRAKQVPSHQVGTFKPSLLLTLMSSSATARSA